MENIKYSKKRGSRLFVFKGNGIIKDEYCSYSDYRAKLSTSKKGDDKESLKKTQQKNKLSFQHRKEHKNLEKQIEKLEIEKLRIENIFKDSNLDYQVMLEKSKQLEKINKQLDEKLIKWMEFDDLNS